MSDCDQRVPVGEGCGYLPNEATSGRLPVTDGSASVPRRLLRWDTARDARRTGARLGRAISRSTCVPRRSSKESRDVAFSERHFE